MGYSSRRGNKPAEYASKSSHSHIVKDPEVQKFLDECTLPKELEEITLPKSLLINLEDNIPNPIKYIIAIDGGFSEIFVKKDFPSSTLTFFQFGALFFSIEDLENLVEKPFIDPKDISKLKEIQRFKLALPTKNIMIKDEDSLTDSVRKTIFRFFNSQPDDNSFNETLKWLIYEEYKNPKHSWNLSNCPSCPMSNISMERKKIKKDYTFTCPYCGNTIYLTDVFRLHEVVDNEIGAGGIQSYLITLLEQITLAHMLKVIITIKPSLLNHILFIKDGPLAFFGQTANIHKPMRKLIVHLHKKQNIFLAGLEKSGAFVEHADQISKLLTKSQALLLSNDYIYKYVVPGKADVKSPYGKTTYYGGKLIFKASGKDIYVVTVPTAEAVLNPKPNKYFNLEIVLHNLKKLKCDMYESSLIPITLVHKLVSLSQHPSSVILEKFAKGSLANH